MNKKQKLNEIGLIKLCSVLRPRQRRILQESPADAGIPARRKNDEKNSSISKL